MWEISENLHRAELTVLQKSDQVARWVALANRISFQVETKIGRGRPEGGERKAARELNLDKDAVNRAVKIASLTPEAKQAAQERGLDDKQYALLAAAPTFGNPLPCL